ncbi:hypothetical protein KZX46_07025 [Polymorphobacter sp. PAMC 29334]|uniref:DUF6489 family protein n=1 Tax=Polymorphobacter sp. PAMC 29334 TaxID=2862331 RepID=UPI001C71E50F|nr:DUF6489 family protein [Polymorphobacter sp. PAMC 29334]QYE35718.1 hypothetical protein KZX46_07025 [Polymorphobacter sp. PAMC 29334]
MKITFDIDCSPQEARAFLGLPDLEPLHALYLDKMKSFVTEGVGPADFERMARAWMPGISEGLETWRNALFNAGRPKSD